MTEVKVKTVHFASAERYEPEPDWRRVSLCAEADLSVEHFAKPPGHASPLHDHPAAQLCLVLQGRLRVEGADGAAAELGELDAAYLPGAAILFALNPFLSLGLDHEADKINQSGGELI